MKIKIIAILALIVVAPACAITGAGMATHHANFLKGNNPLETSGYMIMSNMSWALPFTEAHWFYEHYPAWAFEPAARHLQRQYPNSKLEHWEPWQHYAQASAPHTASLFGAGIGFLFGTIPTLLLGAFKNDETLEQKEERKQKKKKQTKAKTVSESKSLWIGSQRLNEDEEIQHILCIGAPRTGKSQVIQTAAKKARKRKEPAFILDHNAELFSRLYDENKGDILLSANDQRSAPWSPLAEIQGPTDCNRIAHAIIGDGGGGESAEWAQNAKNYTSACLLACLILYKKGYEVTNRTLATFLTQATAESLLGIVGYDHLVASIFQEGAEKMKSSIQGTAGMRANALTALSQDAGFDGFSITKHVTEGNRGGSFIYAAATQRAGETGKELVSILTGIYVDAINQLLDDESRRSWLLFDEAGQYPPIAGFANSVTTASKKGLAAVTAVQTITQFREGYGHDKAGTLLGCFGTRVMFFTPDSETAQWCSDQIGKARRIKKSHTNTESGDAISGNNSTSTQQSEQIEDVVLPHNIKDLQKLQAYITRPAKTGYGQVTVSVTDLGKQVIEPFIEQPFEVEDEQPAQQTDDDAAAEPSAPDEQSENPSGLDTELKTTEVTEGQGSEPQANNDQDAQDSTEAQGETDQQESQGTDTQAIQETPKDQGGSDKQASQASQTETVENNEAAADDADQGDDRATDDTQDPQEEPAQESTDPAPENPEQPQPEQAESDSKDEIKSDAANDNQQSSDNDTSEYKQDVINRLKIRQQS